MQYLLGPSGCSHLRPIRHQSAMIRTASRTLLLAGLVGINAFPFTVTPNTSYETVFYSLSAIHAELCLCVAWGIFVAHRRYSRVVWCLLGTAIAIIAATRLLAGQWTSERLTFSIRWGIGATLPGVIPMIAVFLTQRFVAGTEFIPETKTEKNTSSFRLNYLFVLIAAFAFLSLLVRQLIREPGGWLLGSDDYGITSLAFFQSFVVGLLVGPCALVVLKPNRYCLLWLPYFVLVATMQPFLDQMFLNFFVRKIAFGWDSWVWPESYWSVVLDNITWYGPQLLPTIVLFVIFRFTGVRIQDTK